MVRGRIFGASPFRRLHEIEKKYIGLRTLANRLFFEDGYSKAKIRMMLNVSKQFVITWTQSPDQDLIADGRGWPRGKRRQWSPTTARRISAIHRSLTKSPRQFYTGATAIRQQWRLRYKELAPPPLRTIGQILSDLGLSQPRRQKRPGKGAARYLCYPEHTIYELLGGRVLEADFIGKRFLTGSGLPIHFLALSFKKEPKLRYFYRVDAQTAQEFILHCQDFLRDFEKPDFIKLDNAPATIGSGSGKRTLSQVMLFLLAQQIVPIYAVPRKPFSQASIEGNNSVFARKFWRRHQFRSLRDLDRRLEWFNQASLIYTGYQRPSTSSLPRPFVPRVYFIRQVHEHPVTHRGTIDILHEEITLPASYITYFVLAEWNLSTQTLSIYFEKNSRSKKIKQLPFHINPLSLINYKKAV